jgi:hypothetical protein
MSTVRTFALCSFLFLACCSRGERPEQGRADAAAAEAARTAASTLKEESRKRTDDAAAAVAEATAAAEAQRKAQGSPGR